jgi:hypothetical protein
MAIKMAGGSAVPIAGWFTTNCILAFLFPDLAMARATRDRRRYGNGDVASSAVPGVYVAMSSVRPVATGPGKVKRGVDVVVCILLFS